MSQNCNVALVSEWNSGAQNAGESGKFAAKCALWIPFIPYMYMEDGGDFGATEVTAMLR